MQSQSRLTPDVVAVQQHCEGPPTEQFLLQGASHGALACPAEAGKPQHTTLLLQLALFVFAGHVAVVPVDVLQEQVV